MLDLLLYVDGQCPRQWHSDVQSHQPTFSLTVTFDRLEIFRCDLFQWLLHEIIYLMITWWCYIITTQFSGGACSWQLTSPWAEKADPPCVLALFLQLPSPSISGCCRDQTLPSLASMENHCCYLPVSQQGWPHNWSMAVWLRILECACSHKGIWQAGAWFKPAEVGHPEPSRAGVLELLPPSYADPCARWIKHPFSGWVRKRNRDGKEGEGVLVVHTYSHEGAAYLGRGYVSKPEGLWSPSPCNQPFSSCTQAGSRQAAHPPHPACHLVHVVPTAPAQWPH